MLHLTTGNLLEADVDALVNTVNTVGVMGKGIALMFKEAFPENFKAYRAACRKGEVVTGDMFVTARSTTTGPHWIINFPTKEHWRAKTQPEWIEHGLADLARVIAENGIQSIAVPPLGCGHGGLNWAEVRPMIERVLGPLEDVEILVYEPTDEYQGAAKRAGVEELTPARALVAELIRRYWVLGIECTMLEIQKLAWFLERAIQALGIDDPLDLRFEANRFGPYADRLRHLLDSLDGSYLRSEVRVADAGPTDLIAFNDDRRESVAAYLASAASDYEVALDSVSALIDGFESPLGMELLATVDWLLSEKDLPPHVDDIRQGLESWPGGAASGARKLRIFDDHLVGLALERLHGDESRWDASIGQASRSSG